MNNGHTQPSDNTETYNFRPEDIQGPKISPENHDLGSIGNVAMNPSEKIEGKSEQIKVVTPELGEVFDVSPKLDKISPSEAIEASINKTSFKNDGNKVSSTTVKAVKKLEDELLNKKGDPSKYTKAVLEARDAYRGNAFGENLMKGRLHEKIYLF